MALTTQAIIEMLPLDKDFKKQLLTEWDHMTDDQKFTIEQQVWDTYTNLYDIKYKENVRLAFLDVQDKKEALDKDFYKKIREKTSADMRQLAVQHVTSVDLSSTREELGKILNQTSSDPGNQNN